MFVAMRLRSTWELAITDPEGKQDILPILTANLAPGMQGMLLVFETREQAEEWAEGAAVLEIAQAPE